MSVYTGIGSRRTPTSLLAVMEALAEALAMRGWWLRSGHAPGADQAFEMGAGERAEVYLPWPSFEDSTALRARVIQRRPTEDAHAIAAELHPNWYTLKRGVRLLHARNVHQVLGRRLAAPSRFVVCWTPDGSLDGRGRDTGGTGQALRVAVRYGVPVFNLARESHLERVENMMLEEVEA